MILRFQQLPSTLKGPDDPAYKGRVPFRARLLALEAAASLMRLEADSGGLVYTDIYRSPDASLLALKTKRGVQPPGFSPHNFGYAIDLDVGAVLRRKGWRFPELEEFMESHGWYCHVRDHDGTKSENWHWNFLAARAPVYLMAAERDQPRTWHLPIEHLIVDKHGEDFKLTPQRAQAALKQLGMYDGEIDGIIGPLSKEAIAAFQRAWQIYEKGLGERTQRVLAVVTAEKAISPPAPPV